MIPRDSSVPEIDVDPQQLLDESSTLVSRARTLRDEISQIRDTWSTLTNVFDIEGTEAIYTKLDPTETVVDDYVSSLESAAGALETFAYIVIVLKQQRTELLADLGGARMEEQVAEERGEDEAGTARVYDEDKLRNRIEGLRRSFEQAEDECAATIRGIAGGTGEGMRQAAPSSSFAQYWPSQASAFDARMRDGALRTMDYLTTLSEADAQQWVEDHPDFADAFVVAPPAAAVVAAWWQKMGTGQVGADGVTIDSDAQKHLIAVIPGVIGALGGVDYTSRNDANRVVHGRELARLEALDRRIQGLSTREGLAERSRIMAEYGFDPDQYAEVYERLRAAQAVERTLDSAGDLTYQLVAYSPGVPPLAAISVGNMDTASQITTAVPGMNTRVDSSMESWTGGARNLYLEQGKRESPETSLAVVSWIGYDTPDMLTVLSSDKAEAGSENLEKFLTDTTAATGRRPGEDLSVWAHSYGANVSTLAVSRTPVENLTLAAPAGVDSSIPSVSDLRVDPKRVWVTEANADGVANIGRGSVETGQYRQFYIPSEHPIDPGLPEYGGNQYTSEELVDGRDTYYAVDEHGSVPGVQAELDGKEPGNLGYLDLRTTSLFNASFATLGMVDDIEEVTLRPVRDIPSRWNPGPQPLGLYDTGYDG